MRWYPAETVTAESPEYLTAMVALTQSPSDLFWSDKRGAYLHFGITETSIVLARSVDGISDWALEAERPDWRAQLLALPPLQNQVIGKLIATPIPTHIHGRDADVLLLAIGVMSSEGTQPQSLESFHLATVVIHSEEDAELEIHYHQEVEMPPQMLDIRTNNPDEEVLGCPSASCNGYRGQFAMSLDSSSKLLTLFGQTAVDESFKPQASPSPESVCEPTTEASAVLPKDRVWRRIELLLR